MKRIKKWQEPIYAIGGFGPGFLYQVVLTYLLYYYRPAQARIETGALIFVPAAAYAIGMLVARILDGVVDIYLPDFKYSEGTMAGRYSSGADTYPEMTREALLEMHRQVGVARPAADGLMYRGLMIRHLVMPGGVSGTRKVVEWIRPHSLLQAGGIALPSPRSGVIRGLRRGERGQPSWQPS